MVAIAVLPRHRPPRHSRAMAEDHTSGDGVPRGPFSRVLGAGRRTGGAARQAAKDRARRLAQAATGEAAEAKAREGAALLELLASSHLSARADAREGRPLPGTQAPPPEPEAVPHRMVRAWRIVKDAVGHFLNDEALMTASALAFTLILAFFPFLIFITALGSWLGGAQLAAAITRALFDALPSDIAGALQPQVERVLTTRSGGFLTFGFLVTVFSLTTAIESIRAGLNRAYGVRETRNIVLTRLESLLFVLVGSLTLLLVAFLAVVAPLLHGVLDARFPALIPWKGVYDVVRLALMGLVLFGALLALHVALPAHKRGVKQVWVGAMVTLALWYAAGAGFTFYLTNFGNYAATYAGLAGVVAALFFFYLCSACLLFGGEVNRAIAAGRKRRAIDKKRSRNA